MKKLRVALVYDWLNRWGGAERVIRQILRIWPEAEIFSSVYDPRRARFLRGKKVHTSWLQKLPGARKHIYWYYPWLGYAFESFNFDNYDLVISLSSGPAKAVVTKPETFHLHYCLTPPRYLWQRQFFPWPKLFPLISSWRTADYLYAQRPDVIVAISKTVAERVKKFYHRTAAVIYPGIEVKKFVPTQKPAADGAPFLLVSRLVEYKRVDLAVEAFSRLGWPLWIVGEGRMKKKLLKKAGENIRFLGFADERRLRALYRRARALIMPQEEDFGLVSLEAQASGRPVIAYRGGGATETVIENKTGLFFSPATPEALVTTLRQFQHWRYSPLACRRQAEKFSAAEFRGRFKELVMGKMELGARISEK